ncbi:protein quaking-B-like isoform X5 [Clytia hemisphaerica]|uniref:protein quaking-B-like isoform X5 n=1 Tax=Clytia hemisphaerica TaxID=252671 RepID=UPI0034D4C747
MFDIFLSVKLFIYEATGSFVFPASSWTTQDEHETNSKKARLYNSTTQNSSNQLITNSTTTTAARKMNVPDELTATEYLNQLLQDKTTVSKMPKIFLHSERLLDEEISRVRNDIFCPSSFLMSLPKPSGPPVKLTEKVYAKVKDHPKFNFVGRIIGPRGLTLRQVEQETGGKLLVRGRGSMKDKKVEEEKRGQPNYEHLDEDLHVLIMVEDTEDRARMKLKKAVEEVNFLLTPPKDGEDAIKKKQLQDLAILNGTYRHPNSEASPPAAATVTQNGVSPTGLLSFPSPSPVVPQNNTSFPAIRNSAGEPVHYDNMIFRFCDFGINPTVPTQQHPSSRSFGCCSPTVF